MTRFEASIATLAPSKDPDVLARGKKTFLTLCAPCHRAGRRRPGGPEPVRRLLDPRLQLRGQRDDHLERRAGQGHDHLEEQPQAARRSTTWPVTSTPCAARTRPIPSRRRTWPRSRPARVSLNSHPIHNRYRNRRKPDSRVAGPVKDVDWKDFRDHLGTADQEGRRQWLYPRKVQGRFLPRAHVC